MYVHFRNFISVFRSFKILASEGGRRTCVFVSLINMSFAYKNILKVDVWHSLDDVRMEFHENRLIIILKKEKETAKGIRNILFLCYQVFGDCCLHYCLG
jgi:hypothetical protein